MYVHMQTGHHHAPYHERSQKIFQSISYSNVFISYKQLSRVFKNNILKHFMPLSDKFSLLSLIRIFKEMYTCIIGITISFWVEWSLSNFHMYKVSISHMAELQGKTCIMRSCVLHTSFTQVPLSFFASGLPTWWQLLSLINTFDV